MIRCWKISGRPQLRVTHSRKWAPDPLLSPLSPRAIVDTRSKTAPSLLILLRYLHAATLHTGIVQRDPLGDVYFAAAALLGDSARRKKSPTFRVANTFRDEKYPPSPRFGGGRRWWTIVRTDHPRPRRDVDPIIPPPTPPTHSLTHSHAPS